MQVFKYYFKLTFSLKWTMVMFFGIFMLITMLSSSQLPSVSSFVVQKPKIAVANRDDSEFAAGLVTYLKDHAELIELKDSDEARKEAAYFQKVNSSFIIPEYFGEDFFAHKKPRITSFGGNAQGSVQANTLIHNYLRLAESRVLAGMSQVDTVAGIKEDVKEQATVKTTGDAHIVELSRAMLFMNVLVYGFTSLAISIISAVMVLFTHDMIRKRNSMGGISMRSVTLQVLAGNATFTVAMWAAFMIVAVIMFPSAMKTSKGLLLAVSAFFFSLVCLSLAFMVGSFARNRQAISGINNILALGMSFLCGVFIPLSILGDSVLSISRFLPAYWYVTANEKIVKLTDISLSTLQPIFINWMIILGFAIGIVTLTTITARLRRNRAA